MKGIMRVKLLSLITILLVSSTVSLSQDIRLPKERALAIAQDLIRLDKLDSTFQLMEIRIALYERTIFLRDSLLNVKEGVIVAQQEIISDKTEQFNNQKAISDDYKELWREQKRKKWYIIIGAVAAQALTLLVAL